MKTKQGLYHSIPMGVTAFCLALLMLVTACGGQDEPAVEKENRPELSDKEITLDIEGWKPLTESRANIFENEDDFLNENGGGGNFTLHAYLAESGETFIGGTRVWYFIPQNATTGTWEFYDEPNIIHYYWPQQGTVDFFAYMPWKNSNKRKSIEVGAYTQGSELSITCNMQSTTADGNDSTDDLYDPDGQETIIAYTTGKSKADGSVNMYFVHPFSAVYFKLKQAHRNLTINWISFDNIHLTGSTTLNATTDGYTSITWSPTDNGKGTFTIPVKKTIPGEINFGGEIGGPYMVMPQSFGKNTDDKNDDVTITVSYTWDDGKDDTEDTQEFSRSITTETIKSWIAGNKYTYILDLGDNKEEILFQVLVEPWKSDGHKHIIDVE